MFPFDSCDVLFSKRFNNLALWLLLLIHDFGVDNGAFFFFLTAARLPTFVRTCARVAATRLVRHRAPETQVVILSAYEDRALKRGAEELGVYGYLIKGCPPSLLVDTLRFAWSFKKGSVHARVHPFEPSGGLESSP